MSIAEAKTIPLDAFLEALGYLPVKTISGQFWYYSPFRQEHTPSFKLSRDGRAWFDHGAGQGGNILDLAYHLLSGPPLSGGLTGHQVTQALSYIETTLGSAGTGVPLRQRVQPVTAPPAYVLQSVDPLLPNGLSAAYLRARGIDPYVVVPYARELTFTHANRPARRLNGFGIPNQAGGYEVRARWGDTYLKTGIGPKDISFFPASLASRELGTLHLFEGAPDFYTYLTLYQPPLGQENYLILNGTAQTSRAVAWLSQNPFRTVALWCQYGVGGQRAEAQLLDVLRQTSGAVGTMKHLYVGFEDLNAWHMATTRPVPGPSLPGCSL